MSYKLNCFTVFQHNSQIVDKWLKQNELQKCAIKKMLINSIFVTFCYTTT